MDTEASIYHLMPQADEKKEKPPRYNSKFHYNVKEEYVSNKAGYKTMGQAKVPVPGPDSFLKKHEKEPILPDKKEFKYPDENKKRPPVPKKEEQPLMGLKTTKNFITTNAVQTITSVPKLPEKKFVDTRRGDTHNLIPSGLEPVFTQKKEYGETPEYLKRRQEEIKKAQEEYNMYIAEHFRRGSMKSLSQTEREGILHGLKENWEDLHLQYQGLSVVTDTAPKKNRKERMEAEMKQLERDIETIEKHKIIYIAN